MPPNDARVTVIEQRLERSEERLEKYDQIILEIRRSQDRHDLMLSTFIDEMKVLKASEVDISKLLQTHEDQITEQHRNWRLLLTILKWVVGVLLSIGLLFLGSYLSHLH
jgi:hypothetical protein